MREYTALAVISVLAVVFLDKFSRIALLKKKEYYLFLLIIFCFKLMVNGFLTGRNIVIYEPKYFLGLRFGSIPLEDFLFGFSMVTVSIIFWEYFKQRR